MGQMIVNKLTWSLSANRYQHSSADPAYQFLLAKFGHDF